MKESDREGGGETKREREMVTAALPCLCLGPAIAPVAMPFTSLSCICVCACVCECVRVRVCEGGPRVS